MKKFSIAVVLVFLASMKTVFGADSILLSVRPHTAPSGASFDLVFNRAYSAKNVSTARERNFIQEVLKNARMKASKIIAIHEGDLDKVFAYPFAASTTRVRIIGKTDTAPAGAVSVWNIAPNVVRIFLRHQEVAEVAPMSDKTLAGALAGTKGAGALSGSLGDAHPDHAVATSISVPASTMISSIGKEERSDGSVGIKSDPSRHFTRMFLALTCVLGLFGALVYGFKRYSHKLGKLPFGKKERLIQVVATHHLGNKKSIALVKVTGEYMVVGVSNENISLISKVGSEQNMDKYLEERFWSGTFEKHLDSYAKEPASLYDGAKDLVKVTEEVTDKVELSKQSTVRDGIREKLTSLKPLN